MRRPANSRITLVLLYSEMPILKPQSRSFAELPSILVGGREGFAMPRSLRWFLGSFVILVALAASTRSQVGVKNNQKSAPGPNAKWTYQDVMQEVMRHPDDAYLQYVAVQ